MEVARQVFNEYTDLTNKHMDHKFIDFNKDSNFKEWTREAIDFRALAQKKIEMFAKLLESCPEESDETVLELAKITPILEYADENKVMELESGVLYFPWSALRQRIAIINFGTWKPETISKSPARLRAAAEAIAANDNLRVVQFANSELQLSFADESINWDEKPAVKESPSVVALLLRACTRVKSLSIRHVTLSSSCVSLIFSDSCKFTVRDLCKRAMQASVEASVINQRSKGLFAYSVLGGPVK